MPTRACVPRLLDELGEDFVYEAIEAVDVVLLWWRGGRRSE